MGDRELCTGPATSLAAAFCNLSDVTKGTNIRYMYVRCIAFSEIVVEHVCIFCRGGIAYLSYILSIYSAQKK